MSEGKNKRSAFQDWSDAIKSIPLEKREPTYLKEHKDFSYWGSDDYDMAANAVQNTMQLTDVEWSIIRLAIRTAVEQHS